jgi:hypothetical protein
MSVQKQQLFTAHSNWNEARKFTTLSKCRCTQMWYAWLTLSNRSAVNRQNCFHSKSHQKLHGKLSAELRHVATVAMFVFSTLLMKPATRKSHWHF